MPNGTIVMGDPWIDAQKSYPGDTWDQPLRGNFNQLIKLKQRYPHLKTLISVGGWSWSNRFSDVAADPALRENFANSAVDFSANINLTASTWTGSIRSAEDFRATADGRKTSKTSRCCCRKPGRSWTPREPRMVSVIC
ncbi:hypothetical protein HMSSN036_33270 [Paenibacillus macerans]|nr:hypothetical protein HMSSN036_33270 [Paenibacillus macerans]